MVRILYFNEPAKGGGALVTPAPSSEPLLSVCSFQKQQLYSHVVPYL